MITDWQTLARAEPGLAPGQYDVALRPGTSAVAYAQALQQRLGPATRSCRTAATRACRSSSA